MSTRKSFEKVDAENPSRRDMPRSANSKSFPKEASAGTPGPKDTIGNSSHWNSYNKLHANKQLRTDGNINGDSHNFNIKGKVTSNSGSDYHSFGRADSGLHGNFADKDASLAYLRDRNKQGIEVKHFSGTTQHAKLKIGNGSTAFDGRPIPEVYQPATSNGTIDPNAVVYKATVKSRQEPMPYQQNVESNKTTKPIAKHIKEKE